MDRVERLEKRIKELEYKIEMLEAARMGDKRDKTKEAMSSFAIFSIAVAGREDFEKHISKKYSKENFREKGFPEEYNKLDINDAFKRASNKKHRDDKLLFWNSFRNQILRILKDDYHSDFWYELKVLINMAVEYYKEDVIRYIIKEGKYVDKGGPREQTDIKEKGYHIYKELKQSRNTEFFHQNGRHKGGPKWDEIEPILREKLDKNFGSLRAVKDYIRNQEK